MWLFFGLYDISILIFILKHLINLLRLDVIVYRLVFLGLLPGINFQITFAEIVITLWVIFFAITVYKLFFRAQKIIYLIDPFKNLPKNFAISYILYHKN